MRTILRKLTINASRSSGSWLILLLLLVVLVPSLCLLWFMNQAVKNERLAVRQKLIDAYRGHLSLAQERLSSHWSQAAAELDGLAEKTPAPALFAQLVQSGAADAVICYDADGNLVYPKPVLVLKSGIADSAWAEAAQLESSNPLAAAAEYARRADQATDANLAAQALQAQARCLLKGGKKAEVIALLTGRLAEDRYWNATDAQGRLVRPNADFMALELTRGAGINEMGGVFERLKTRLLDYNDSALASSQRRFLMREMEKLFPGQVAFPTLQAEGLATRYIEEKPPRLSEPALGTTVLPGIWRFASSRGHVLTLHQTEHLLSRMRATVASPSLPRDVRIDVLVPGGQKEGALLVLPGGPQLPGWQLALSLMDQPLFDAATDARISTQIWVGVLAVLAVVILALFALRLIRRQMEVTQLRNDLVANVSHELKTPLSSMRLLVDTLLDSNPLHEKTAREYLELIARENARLSRLIDNFLAFSRMERNKYSLDCTVVEARFIVEEAAAAVRERLHVAGCCFETRVEPNLPRIKADSDAMVTALVNLLDNAFKYSGEDKRIELTASGQGASVIFTVKDNGIGLSAREAKRIFKRFYRVDQRLSRTADGCGLGLSIVKFVVEAHRGTVEVESQPGRGSVFTIALPALGVHEKEESQP